ncbi:MAG: hypothetical protein JRI23_33365 [Deltaproteobacteria bacterium]|nr:hypothetical protein [Deltaproteobacteria bacterium]MBW2537168.1 hypothetical protein [Deltaproteobacteria bacterium]
MISVGPYQTISDQELRDLGFILVNDYPGVDPTGTSDSLAGINQAIVDGINDNQTVWFHADAVYRVSDTVRIGLFGLGQICTILGGGGPGSGRARPKIVLEDNAAGFNNGGGAMRPVVCWRLFSNGATSWPADPLDNSGTYQGQANILFDSAWMNIDIDCGNNSDAFGMYFPAAQRVHAGEVTIDASGALGGWKGLLGRNSAMQNIKIVGGVWQLHNADAQTAEGSAGSCVAGLELVGDVRTTEPILHDDFVPLVIVGAKIVQTNGNPIFTSPSGISTGAGILCLIDAEITTGGGTVFDNTTGKTLYLRNVYVRGTDQLVQSGSEPAVTATGAWKRIDEYAYTDQTPTNAGAREYRTQSLINGVVSSAPEPATAITSGAAAPTTDFVARHSINVPKVDRGPYVDIADHGAVGVLDWGNSLFENDQDNATPDSRAAIQEAIDAAEAAGHNTVFVPRGTFFVGSPGVALRKDTKLIGTGASASVLAPHGSWTPTSKTYFMTTADDANGTAHFSNVGLTMRCKDGTTGSASQPYGHDWFSYINWQTGKGSSSIQIHQGREWMASDFWCNPKDVYAFSNNGGGKHYSFTDADGRRFGHPDCRVLRVTGTSQPLHIYGLNMEISKAGAPDADINAELDNAHNVRLYSCKREGHAPSASINDCTNVALYGFGRQISTVNSYHIRIQGSSDQILIAPSVADQANLATDSGRGNPEEELMGQSLVEITWPEGCSLYKRGELDDDLAAID